MLYTGFHKKTAWELIKTDALGWETQEWWGESESEEQTMKAISNEFLRSM